MRTLPTIKFILLKNNVHACGEADLYLEFTNAETKDFRRRISMQKRFPAAAWVGSEKIYLMEKGANAYHNAREWNVVLRDVFQKGDKIILDAYNSGETDRLDFETFKERLMGKRKKPFVMTDLHGDFLAEAKGRAENTLDSYERWNHRLKEYAPELSPADLTLVWIREYGEYLRAKFGKNTNSVYRDLWYLRRLCEIAVKKKWMPANPFDDYPLTKLKVNKVFLTFDEFSRLSKLYGSGVLPVAGQQQLKNWLWCGMTGMDYADLEELYYEEINKVTLEVDGQPMDFHFINKQREKNEEYPHFFVPIVPDALELIKPLLPEGKIFQTISNTKANKSIKPIMKMVGIRKHVNFKTARHTAATMFLNFGARKEVVSDMLGHSSTQMTDHYAKLINQTTLLEIYAAWNRRRNFTGLLQQAA